MFQSKGKSEVEGPLKKLDGAEKMPGVTVKRIDREEFLKRESQIRQLRYNVQSPANDNINVQGHANDNIYKKKTSSERRGTLKPVRGELKSSPDHVAIYLATDKNDKVIGFMYIELEPNGHKARLKEAWSSVPEASQVEMIEKFLDRAKEDLPDDRYPHLDVEDSELTKHFRNLAGNPSYSFVRIKKVVSSPAANENSPERPLRHHGEKAF